MSEGRQYTVTFFKTVAPDHGEDREIVERAVAVAAPDDREAVAQAQAAFCRAEGVAHWTMRADRYLVTLDGPCS